MGLLPFRQPMLVRHRTRPRHQHPPCPSCCVAALGSGSCLPPGRGPANRFNAAFCRCCCCTPWLLQVLPARRQLLVILAKQYPLVENCHLDCVCTLGVLEQKGEFEKREDRSSGAWGCAVCHQVFLIGLRHSTDACHKQCYVPIVLEDFVHGPAMAPPGRVLEGGKMHISHRRVQLHFLHTCSLSLSQPPPCLRHPLQQRGFSLTVVTGGNHCGIAMGVQELKSFGYL